MNATRLAAPLVLAVAAATAWADGEVSLEVRGNEKIFGTIRPATQVEDFVVNAPKGSWVTLNLKKIGDGGPVPSFEILDDLGAVLSTGTPNAKGAKVLLFPLPKTGTYRVRVKGDGVLDGDYQLKLQMRPQGGLGVGGSALLDPAATVDIDFSAPKNATGGFSFSAWRTPQIAPRLVSIDGPDGFHHDFGTEGQTATRQKVRDVPLGAMGDYTLRLRNDGAAAGTWSAGISLSFPEAAKTTVDIRDSELAGAFGDSTVFGRVVDLTGGLVDPADAGGPLDGASVNVPPDAMPTPTVIALSSSDTFFVDDAQHAAGIALKLSPAGTQFATPVTVTIPYDPQSFDDPANELSVYIEDGVTGELVPVDRSLLVIDTVNARVSFPTSHFSRFQGTTPRPRPVKGTFVQLEVSGRPTPGFGGQMVFGLSGISAFKGPRSGNGFQRQLRRTFLGYGANGLAFLRGGGQTDAGILEIDEDSRITMKSSIDGDLTFVRGRNPDVLIQPPGPGDAGAATSLVLRVAKGAPTAANLAGLWQMQAFEFAEELDDGGTLRLQTTGQALAVEIGLDLSVRPVKAFRHVARASKSDGGGWEFADDKTQPAAGTLDITNPEGPLLTMAIGSSPLIPSVVLVPVLSGDALIGVSSGFAGSQQSPTAAAMRLVLLVRASAIGSEAVLGDALTSAFAVSAVARADGGQDFNYVGDDAKARHAADRTLEVKGTRVVLAHDTDGNVTRNASDLDQTNTFSVAKDGTYRETQPFALGAVARRGGFYVFGKFGGPQFSIGFGVVGPPKD